MSTQASRTFAQYAVVSARTGAPTAVHVPSGCLLHSSIDPVAEAKTLADEICASDAATVIIVGGGLGYLPEALIELRKDCHVYVIEPDLCLPELARIHRPHSPYASSKQIAVLGACASSAASKRLEQIPPHASVHISPYLMRISAAENSPLSKWIQILRAEYASRSEYDQLLVNHEAINCSRVKALKTAAWCDSHQGKPILVCGAGPSLASTLKLLHAIRDRLIVVAASGAVPVLERSGCSPDWAVAMEAKPIVAEDIAGVGEQTNVIVFPCTYPEVFNVVRPSRLFASNGLMTRGGSSLIPALDFALLSSHSPIFLIGADLSNLNGGYSAGVNRDSPVLEIAQRFNPKFLSMRAGLERLLVERNHAQRPIYHVLDRGTALAGTIKIDTSSFAAMLAKHINVISYHDE